MKYMIRCDMEGVSGVVSYKQATPEDKEYAFGQAMFMNDLMATINGLNDGGATHIEIYDEHFYGRNIDLDALPDNVVVYCGKPPYKNDWAGGLDKSFDGLILLGFHSKYGSNELLHHSYELDIKNIKLNGVSVGEIGIETAIAGDYNVPLLLITADSAGVKEAKDLVENVVGVSVKESLSPTGALCYPLSITTNNIYEAAKNIVVNKPKVEAYKISETVVLQIELHNSKYLNRFKKYYSSVIEDNVITIIGETVTETWATYWNMKLNCQ